MLEKTNTTLFRSFGLLVGYMACLWAVRLVFLTIVTFIAIRSNETLHKVDETIRANQILVYGISAAIFCGFLQMLYPLTQTRWKEFFDLPKLKPVFASNALGGMILALVLVMGTLLSGHITWLGIYMRFDEVALSMASALFYAISFFLLIVVEEYIFRQALEPGIRSIFGPVGVALTCSLAFVGLKWFQFDLTWLEAVNFALLNLILSLIARSDKTHMASACFAGTFILVCHVFFGLPFLGQDTPRIFLLRANPEDSLNALLSGGASGPESSLVLTVLLAIYLYLPQTRSKIRSKKAEV